MFNSSSIFWAKTLVISTANWTESLIIFQQSWKMILGGKKQTCLELFGLQDEREHMGGCCQD